MLTQNEENIRQELLRLMKVLQCPICLNLMSDPMVTRCVHHFCGQCITKAIDSSSGDYCRCPLCNHKITKRSLRAQLEVFDLIQGLKAAVDSFENDNQMSLITDNNDMVVFDVSSDKSKSYVRSNDSFNDINETKELDKTEESMDTSNVSAIESSDIESNRKTAPIISVSDEWPTCESSNGCVIDVKDFDETDPYFESTNSLIKGKSDESIDSFESEAEPTFQPIPTQSQNLKVTKSRITYSSSRPPTDDKFDRIIRLSEINSNLNRSDPKENLKEVRDQNQNHCPIEEDFEHKSKTNRRKPLTQMNRNADKNINQKKKFKTIEVLDSSDEDFESIVTKSKAKYTEESMQSDSDRNGLNKDTDVSLIYDDKSDDLFLPAIHNKNSIEFNRSNSSVRDESKDGYNSDTQLITSSPVSDF